MFFGMPISQIRTSPLLIQPGSTNSPGFASVNVTVTLAFTESPSIEPVSACTPEGVSADIIVAPELLIALTAERAFVRRFEFNPIPNIASITTAQVFRCSLRSDDCE